jgi:ribosomal protein S18 acetylase RimI-like enzyme
MTMIEIRSLTIDEPFDDLISLSQEYFHEYQVHHPVFFKIDNLKDQDVIRYFSSFCENENRGAFLALVNGQIIGYITIYIKEQADYWQIRRVGEISGLMVGKDYRRLGIGKRLFDQAKVFFAARGVRYYTIYTSVENQAALDFYRQIGMMPLYTTMVGEV